MQEDIRFTLFIIGIAVIGGVLLHGIWTIRKNGKKSKRASFESKNWEPGFEHEDDLDADVPLYDDVGVSKARVIFNARDEKTAKKDTEIDTEQSEPLKASHNSDLSAHTSQAEHESFCDANTINFENAFTNTNEDSEQSQLNNTINLSDAETDTQEPYVKRDFEEDALEQSPNDISDKAEKGDADNDSTQNAQQKQEKPEPPPHVYSNVVTQPKPEFHKPSVLKDALSDDFGQPPGFLLKTHKENEQSVSVAKNTNNDLTEKVSETDVGDAAVNDSQDKIDSSKTAPQKALQETQQEPPPVIYETTTIPETAKAPEFSLNIQDGPKKSEKETPKPGVEKELSFAEQAKRFVRRNKKSVSDKIRKEPVMKTAEEDQLHIDFDAKKRKPIVREEQLDLIGHDNNHDMTNDTRHGEQARKDELKNPQTSAANVAKQKAGNEKSSVSAQEPQGDPVVLVLNVKADASKPIEGAALLPMLLTLGLKFGEHEIFHRHVNTNGKGPILFSLANMLKPGNFDIDNIENFSTLGLSLFMMLPIEGDAQQVFNMMHNAARKLADEFGCRILDGNKVVLSKQSLQQYAERIREFERKRSNR